MEAIVSISICYDNLATKVVGNQDVGQYVAILTVLASFHILLFHH